MLLLVAISTISAEPVQMQNGVIIHKVGNAYLFIFPASQGRLKATDNPAGIIEIGKSIKVMYALKIINKGKARFIGLDGSTLSPKLQKQLKPVLKTQNMNELFGFLVKDTNQPLLHMHIKPGFMDKASEVTQEDIKEKMARQGNLTVIFGPASDGGLKIMAAILD